MYRLYFYEGPKQRFRVKHEFEKCIAVGDRKHMHQHSPLSIGMMKSHFGYTVPPPMPIDTVGHDAMRSMITPKSDGNGFVYCFGHKTIINPKVHIVN